MKMRILIILTILFLNGCVSGKYGNFTSVKNLSSEVTEEFANSAYTQLITLYAPGKTHFKLEHDFNDSFGVSLYEKLQKEGYALSANTADKKKDDLNTHSLAYVVDEADNNIYRLSLIVDGFPITKAFLIQNEKALSLGFWTKQNKE
ncbi:hypothetical protein J3U08_11220 [Gilliamella sp. B2894]|uniref:hypothetical protein n=1 Tax=Gilliamella sp. B2894 TaxID=2817978 RepID=UPI00226AF5D9|nr:hypothetical protein [Gilliamella sp. B2894]MCX8657361.1 hypothetical protein [Gilliamella sp. B2894]